MTNQQRGRGFEVIQGGKPKCPSCGSYNIESGYGVAAGGMGSYSMCLDCDGPLFDVIQDEESEGNSYE